MFQLVNRLTAKPIIVAVIVKKKTVIGVPSSDPIKNYS